MKDQKELLIKGLKELKQDQITHKKELLKEVFDNELALKYKDDGFCHEDFNYKNGFIIENFLFIYHTMKIIILIDETLEDEKELNIILEDFNDTKKEINKESLLEYIQEWE